MSDTALRDSRRRRRDLIIGLVVVLLASILVPWQNALTKHIVSRIDQVTGTMVWTTTWAMNLHSPTVKTDTSPLEKR